MSTPKSRTIELANDEAALLSVACQWAVNVCDREMNSWSSGSFYDEDAGVWRQEQYKDYSARAYALNFALLAICSRVHQELNSGFPLFPDEEREPPRISVYRMEEGALGQAVMMFVMDREAWVNHEIEQGGGADLMPQQAAEFKAYRQERHKELSRCYKKVCDALDPINAKRAP